MLHRNRLHIVLTTHAFTTARILPGRGKIRGKAPLRARSTSALIGSSDKISQSDTLIFRSKRPCRAATDANKRLEVAGEATEFTTPPTQHNRTDYHLAAMHNRCNHLLDGRNGFGLHKLPGTAAVARTGHADKPVTQDSPGEGLHKG